MAGKRYSPFTLAGMAILVGGIYMVGTKVDEPPKAPPAPPPPVPAAPDPNTNIDKFAKGSNDPKSVAQGIKDQMHFQEKMKFKADREKHYWGGAPPPKTDEISPVYFSNGQMGASGEAKAESLADKKKRIDDIVAKEVAAKYPGGMKPPPLQMSPNQLMDPKNHGKPQLRPAQSTETSNAGTSVPPTVPVGD